MRKQHILLLAIIFTVPAAPAWCGDDSYYSSDKSDKERRERKKQEWKDNDFDFGGILAPRTPQGKQRDDLLDPFLRD